MPPCILLSDAEARVVQHSFGNRSVDPFIALAHRPVLICLYLQHLKFETYFEALLVRISTMRLSSVESPASAFAL